VTTKIKITIGFGIMIALLAGVAVFGFMKMGSMADGFELYQRYATVTTDASEVDKQLSDVLRNFNRFLWRTDEESAIDAGLANLENAKKHSMEISSLTGIAERRRFAEDMAGRIENVKSMLISTRAIVVKVKKLNHEALAPSISTIQKAFEDMSRISNQVGNTAALFKITTAWDTLGDIMVSMGRFLESLEVKETASALSQLEKLGQDIQGISPTLTTADGRRLLAALVEAQELMVKSTKYIQADATQLEKVARETRTVILETKKQANDFYSRVNSEGEERAKAMLSANNAAKTFMLAVIAVGVLLGVAIAGVILLGLIHVLKDLARFADAIAKGDFSYDIKSREKGEIGVTVAAMRQIPKELRRILETTRLMAHDVRRGKLGRRLDANELPGEFSGLAVAVNTVGDAFSSVIDEFPPIMACTTNNQIIHLNRTAKAAMGGDFCGETCSRHLNAPECGKESCIGNLAMTRRTASTQETMVTLNGKKLDVAVTAMPIIDEKNTVVGYYEFLRDISEAKNRERAIQGVTDQASEISSRMAAASEELSSQVDQVSNGAMLQRERMESTASAMNEMNSTVLEVARNASQASEQSDSARTQAESGAGLVGQVVQAINNVNNVALSLQDNMRELGSKAESIGGVMNVISDIADQTNLLALNAAIEAARAGEAGRGFAVVADEVRKLAEKTMSATQEVGGNIAAIQQSTTASIDKVEMAVKNISEATSLANSSGAALKEIVGVVASTSSVVSSIATAAEQQSATSEEINHSIEEVTRIVAETAEGMEQSNAAVRELSQMAQQLRTVMDKLK
jgi:methyl-accepting chemotaxis protein